MLAPIAAAAAMIAGCPLFPASWSTNQRVDTLPVAPDSAAIVRSIGVDGALKADFGSGLWEGGPIGIPYDVVTRRTRRSKVRFEYAGESDRVRYPIPRGVQIEGGPDADGDRHALLVDRNRCKLFELYALRREGGALDGRLRRDVEPARPAPAAVRLDERRRRRAADPAAARALPGGQARAHRGTRCA